MSAETRFKAHAMNMLIGYIGIMGGKVLYTQAYKWAVPLLGSAETFEKVILGLINDRRVKLVSGVLRL